jgi:hypothetical protein
MNNDGKSRIHRKKNVRLEPGMEGEVNVCVCGVDCGVGGCVWEVGRKKRREGTGECLPLPHEKTAPSDVRAMECSAPHASSCTWQVDNMYIA